MRDLKTQARVFQNNRCSACQAPLDLPAVHFLCMHSFHQARGFLGLAAPLRSADGWLMKVRACREACRLLR